MSGTSAAISRERFPASAPGGQIRHIAGRLDRRADLLARSLRRDPLRTVEEARNGRSRHAGRRATSSSRGIGMRPCASLSRRLASGKRALQALSYALTPDCHDRAISIRWPRRPSTARTTSTGGCANRCPVAHSDAWGGFWALTKHDDVAAAASDYRTFITSVQNVVPKVAFTGRRPPLHLDPPEHTPYRRALAPLLSERAWPSSSPSSAKSAATCCVRWSRRAAATSSPDFSAPMPIATFAHWMNLQAEAIAELTARRARLQHRGPVERSRRDQADRACCSTTWRARWSMIARPARFRRARMPPAPCSRRGWTASRCPRR